MGNRSKAMATTATEALRVLWEEGVFRTWRRKPTIVENLDKKGYHFSDAELGMAMMRARHLTRRGKRGAYEYIQKYPYAIETQAKKE